MLALIEGGSPRGRGRLPLRPSDAPAAGGDYRGSLPPRVKGTAYIAALLSLPVPQQGY